MLFRHEYLFLFLINKNLVVFNYITLKKGKVMNLKKMFLGAVCSSFCLVGVYQSNAAAPAAKAPAVKSGAMTVTVSKTPEFNLDLLKGWTYKKSEYKYILIPPSKYPHIQLWYLKDNKDIASAEKNIDKLIKSEVLKFKVSKKEDLTVAGKPAVLLTGSGLEADDQDPSNAKVFLFEANSKVFVLCIHGEGDEAAKNSPIVKKMLESLKLAEKK